MSVKKINIAVLASGSGSNFEAIARAVARGKIRRACIAVMLTDKKGAFARERARKLGVPGMYLNPRDFSSREEYDKEIVKILKGLHVELVVLAGYMRILSPGFVRAFKDRVINIHPALLPAFKGEDAIRRAWQYGVKVTGVTVHFIDDQVDHGPIIAQSALEIKKNESLAGLEKRVHRAEHTLYPYVIDRLIAGKISVRGRNVTVR